MAKLIYSAITSLDGYVADENGNFDWAAPDEEVHRFVNDLERPIGTYLYGRRIYETMVYWETAHTLPDQPPFIQDFAGIWQAADKIVYSKALETPSSARTRIERDFDPEVGRRIPLVPHAHHRWRRKTVAPRQCPPGARTAGRTPFRQRGGSPPLPGQAVRRRRRQPADGAHGVQSRNRGRLTSTGRRRARRM